MDRAKQVIVDFAIQYGFQVVGALVILVVGVFVAKAAGEALMRGLMKREMEPPVRTLIVRITRLLIMILTLVIAADSFGVPVAPLITGIGVAGVGIGLALQGVLGNLVAGLFIILVKPFRVGEYVELLGVHGQVQNIELFNTTLTHADRSKITIPNRKIVGEILHNYGHTRQIALEFGVAYATDLNLAMSVIREVLGAHPKVIKDPAPIVAVRQLADSSITIFVGPWAPVSDYGAVRGDLMKQIFERLVAAGIEIPFPQRQIRILNPGFSAAAAERSAS